MANPQPEDGYVKLANEIWNEIIRRDFSKRQKDIILFIWRLSYGCRKKTAIIPMLKDFEMCGVGYQNIRKELDHLSSSKVISWMKDSNVFSVNKDYEQWQITPVKGWSEERFKELISVNLVERRTSTSQIEKPRRERSTGKLLYASQNKKCLLLKTRSGGFSKREVEGVSNPCGCKAKRVSKDIIKNNIKDSSNSCCLEEDSNMNQVLTNDIKPDSQDAVPAGDADSNRKAADVDYRRQVTNLYLKRRAKGIDLAPKDELFLDELIADGVPISIALAGINQSFDKFKPKHKKDEIKSLSYCEGIIYSLHAEAKPEAHKSKIINNTAESQVQVVEESPSEEEIQKMLAEMRSSRG